MVQAISQSELPKPNRLHYQSKITTKSRYFADKVIDLIKSSTYAEGLRFKHAAIIVKGGNIISFGINSLKSHSFPRIPILLGESNRALDNVLTIHAEMQAILNCKNKDNLYGANMFVARYSPIFGEKLSCPCQSCEYYLHKYGIHKVYYSTELPGIWHEVRIK